MLHRLTILCLWADLIHEVVFDHELPIFLFGPSAVGPLRITSGKATTVNRLAVDFQPIANRDQSRRTLGFGASLDGRVRARPHGEYTNGDQANSGFTMFEALVAIALMGLIMGALATVTAQWLPNWTRGLVQTQRNEQLAIALDRLAADLSAAEFVSPNRSTSTLLFGCAEMAVTFVRSALGPNSRPGLEIVQIAETTDSRGRLTAIRDTREPLAANSPEPLAANLKA